MKWKSLIFILIYNSENFLIDTIKSRCIEFKIFFSNLEKQKILELKNYN